MGARLTCSCPEAYCYGSSITRFRIHAELFELSADGSRWQLVEPRLLYVTAAARVDGIVNVKATSQTGRTLLDTLIHPGQRLEKISDCFVFWRDANGKTYGVNTLSAKDASQFVAHVATPPPPPAMLQHNMMAEVLLKAVYNENRIQRTECRLQSTMVSLNPLNLVFHHNHGLVSVDLLECCVCPTTSQNVFHLAYASNLYEFHLSSDADSFVRQMLNMSSLLLARTTSPEVGTSYLQRQIAKNEEKLALLKSDSIPEPNLMEKLWLKRMCIRQRLAALNGEDMTANGDHFLNFPPPIREQLLLESQLASLFLIYCNMYNFRMWRKPAEVRANDLKALASHDPHLASCTASTSAVVVHLPNGKATAVSHVGDNEQELLQKICGRLAVRPELFSLSRASDGSWHLRHRDEYEVVKTEGKLGLTIYAHNEKGIIKAEVRGVSNYSPGGAAVGDHVISVDGRMISQVSSAGDVERLLREGRVIRLRRKGAKVNETPEIPSTDQHPQIHRARREIAAPPKDSRMKMDEKMIRGIEELVATERKYVDDLGEMIDRFLCIRTVKEIMESALRLQKIQNVFFEALQEAAGDVTLSGNPSRALIRDAVMRIGALFVNRCSELKVYAEYAAGYLRLQRELAANKDLLTMLEAANRSGEQHCSYESKMIRPIQRVVQYPLLLKAIQAGCEAESIEARQLEAAHQKMQTLAEYVNEMQRIHEQFASHLDSVRKQHQPLLNQKGLRLDVRDLLLFAHIRWLNGDRALVNYVIFVFQSLVLLLPAQIRGECKTKYTRVLPINEVDVDDAKGGDAVIVLTHMAFRAPNGELSHGNQEAVYHLECCQAVLKQQLVKSIRKARTAFVRETRRPLSGSSQSDGGYGSDPSKDRSH